MPCGGPCPRGDCRAEREGPCPPWELLRRGCPCPTEGMEWDSCPIEQGEGPAPQSGWRRDLSLQNKAQRDVPVHRRAGREPLPHRTRHSGKSHSTGWVEEVPFPTEQGTEGGSCPQRSCKRDSASQRGAQGGIPGTQRGWRGLLSPQNKAQGRVQPHMGVSGRGPRSPMGAQGGSGPPAPQGAPAPRTHPPPRCPAGARAARTARPGQDPDGAAPPRPEPGTASPRAPSVRTAGDSSDGAGRERG